MAWYHTSAASKDSDTDKWVVDVAQVRGLTTKHPQNQTVQASDHVTHIGGAPPQVWIVKRRQYPGLLLGGGEYGEICAQKPVRNQH